MRKLLLTVAALLTLTYCFAQTDAPSDGSDNGSQVKRKRRCSKVYIDGSTGINNNGGLLGFGVDYHVSSDISINAGIGGITSWGSKLYLGGKCYLKPCHRGWALGGGLTYSSGIASYVADMETNQSGSETVELRFMPQANVFVAAYRHWTVGKNRNRMYFQVGWSKPITMEKFRQLQGNPISSNSAAVIKFLSPAGPILALGFSIGT